MSRLPNGRYIYEVTSGRIKFGPKIYLPGERLGITDVQALSLWDSGQLKFIKALPSNGKFPRKTVPGETLRKMSQNDMKRIPREDVKRMAQNEFGLILTGRDNIKAWIREIAERKKRCRIACLPT